MAKKTANTMFCIMHLQDVTAAMLIYMILLNCAFDACEFHVCEFNVVSLTHCDVVWCIGFIENFMSAMWCVKLMVWQLNFASLCFCEFVFRLCFFASCFKFDVLQTCVW